MIAEATTVQAPEAEVAGSTFFELSAQQLGRKSLIRRFIPRICQRLER